MRKGPLITLIVLAVAIIAAVVGYWLAGRHFVKTDDGTIVLEKRFLTLNDTFVDIRDWTSDDFERHTDLRRAMIAQGYRDLIVEARVKDLENSIEEIGAEFGEQIRNIGGAIEDWAETMEEEASEANRKKDDRE